MKKNWQISSKREITSGTRVNDHCTLGQYKSLECQLVCTCFIIALVTVYTYSYSFLTEKDDENHETNPKHSSASNVKSFVREKYAERIMKPSHLLERIHRENLAVPLKSKIISFLQSLHIQKIRAATICAEELRSWFEKKNN